MSAIPQSADVAPAAGSAADAPPLSTDAVVRRVGELTRTLHEALRELGYHRAVEDAVSALPDARARLGYIASLTGSAAERVLNAAEAAKDAQARIAEGARTLEARWVTANADPDLTADTRAYLQHVAVEVEATQGQLTDIILAQDFHDLTGQVINRVVALAQTLEEQLLQLLLDAAPPAQRVRLTDGAGLAGPVVEGVAGDEVVTNQAQVDDLLESLGF